MLGVTRDDADYSVTGSAIEYQGCHLDEEEDTDSADGYQCDYSDGEESWATFDKLEKHSKCDQNLVVTGHVSESLRV